MPIKPSPTKATQFMNAKLQCQKSRSVSLRQPMARKRCKDMNFKLVKTRDNYYGYFNED